MRNLILIGLVFVGIACKTATHAEKESLPYFHTAEFTPLWITDKSQLDTLHTLSDFEFLNQNNEKISAQTFRGKIHVMNCFFTICPSLCPRLMSSMKQVQKAFKDDRNVLIASFSVTPDRDSVSVLRAYADTHEILAHQWHLLTGDKNQIYQIARKSYFADENIGVQKGTNDFLHTENFILVDKNLHIRGIYNGTLQIDIDNLINDIKVLENEN